MTTFHRILISLAVITSIALSGCAREEPATSGATAEPVATIQPPVEGLTAGQQAALIERVEEKWQAMERWDYERVYELTTPNYREIFSKSLFVNKFGYDLRWELTGIEVLHYDASAAVASVAVRVMSESTKPTSAAAGMGRIPDTIKESWFLLDGQWWNSAK